MKFISASPRKFRLQLIIDRYKLAYSWSCFYMYCIFMLYFSHPSMEQVNVSIKLRNKNDIMFIFQWFFFFWISKKLANIYHYDTNSATCWIWRRLKASRSRAILFLIPSFLIFFLIYFLAPANHDLMQTV